MARGMNPNDRNTTRMIEELAAAARDFDEAGRLEAAGECAEMAVAMVDEFLIEIGRREREE